MFDGIIKAFSTFVTIAIVILVLGLIYGIAMCILGSKRQAEIRQREEEEKRNLINTVIADSRQFPTDVLISQRSEVARAYNELLECRRTGSMKIKEMVLLRVGNDCNFYGMDIDTCSTILQCLNSEIERRR